MAGSNSENKTIREVKDKITAFYRYAEDWIRPEPDQGLILQILVFVLKLPLLLLLILLSPFLLLILILLFFIAL